MTPSFPRTGVSGHAGAVQRGDGNLHPESPYARNASNVSSDPKPREGTETRNPAPHPQLRHAPEVVRPKTPRGDGNARNRPTWACPQRVVRPKTPRGDGNSITLFLSVARLRVSSDPKPREGTETRKRSTSLTILFSRRQTQNPERGRKHFERELVHSPPFRSSDPKPREGTETPRGWRMRCARKCRQTQNPERGRKPASGKSVRSKRFQRVVRPKTPRGDGNSITLFLSVARLRVSSDPKPREGTETRGTVPPGPAPSGSSDPKPREGTETRNPAPHPQLRHAPEVVRPKTPRGDGNAYRPPHHSHATAPCPQTQNPERGRKLVRHLCLIQVQCPVVRPKTPRGDGNTETQHQPDNLILASSDPKPREGTETPRGWRMRCARKCRQTQNPERGRKLDAESHRVREVQQSSDPKPREGTETRRWPVNRRG
ncbi:Uncharacterised protein [Mycobacterium tuberculosis]|nr:Uncharacterised protein [Mycobacterium tuberculosis]